MFRDRLQAAEKLAQQLRPYQQRDPLVLGIARGAVPMAQRIAQLLGASWDILLAKKLAAPGNPEYAVGAVDETGWVYRSDLCDRLGVSEEHLQHEKDRQMAIMKQRRTQYEKFRKRVPRKSRTVIVVDDGLATGATMIAALHGLKQEGASTIVCAVPIASAGSLEKVRKVADKVVCLLQPEEFYAVSQGYESFEQVEDEKILELLQHD